MTLLAERAGLVFLIALQTSCAGDPFTDGCERVGDVCAGVPNQPVCEEDFCTQGVACAGVLHADSDASFAAAVAGASPGACIALAPGDYDGVTLPESVSLLGRGAAYVTVGSVETNGEGVTVRGITIAGGSLVVRSGSTTAEMIRVVSLGDGVWAGPRSTVTFRNSEVRGYVRTGVRAFDVAALNIESSLIEESILGPGMWIECSEGCACTTRPSVSMTNVRIARAKSVGMSIVGTNATLANVEVRDTAMSQNSGGGIAVSKCSTLTATDLRTVDNDDFGLLIHDSSMTVDALTANGNLRGVAILAIGHSMPGNVTIRSAEISGNRGMGIDLAKTSLNVTIEDSHISDTSPIELPRFMNDVQVGTFELADGILWRDGSHLALRAVSVSRSQRQNILIDDGVAPGSLIDHVELSGIDETEGIIQQNFVEGVDLTPTLIASPPITTTPDEVWNIPND